MIDKTVYSQLYKKKSFRHRSHQNEDSRDSSHYTIPMRHIIAALLIMLILGAWALDSLHVSIMPDSVHRAVCEYTDPLVEGWNFGLLAPGINQDVAHNPINGSPVTAGSVLLLWVICTVGLVVTRFPTSRGSTAS